MFKGIFAKVVDTIGEFEQQHVWQRRLDEMSVVYTKWTEQKVGVPVKFQTQIVAMNERKGGDDTQEFKDLVVSNLNFWRGQYIKDGFDMLAFIYDKFSPDGWLHTPEYDSDPKNTEAFTNVGDTITVRWVEPATAGDYEFFVRKILSNVVSLELLHMLLYRRQALQGKRPDPNYFDNAVHENFHQGKYEIFEGWSFLEIPIEP